MSDMYEADFPRIWSNSHFLLPLPKGRYYLRLLDVVLSLLIPSLLHRHVCVALIEKYTVVLNAFVYFRSRRPFRYSPEGPSLPSSPSTQWSH